MTDTADTLGHALGSFQGAGIRVVSGNGFM
jgi:hypothetical protein